MRRWRWAAGAIFVVLLIGGTLLTHAIVELDETVQHADDNVNCILYELYAHRLANQESHDHAMIQHGFSLPLDADERPHSIPGHLRAACEAILPGSTR